MRIGWRDGLATLVVAAAVGLWAAFALDRPIAGFASVASVAVAVLVLGIVGCAPAVIAGFSELMGGSRVYLAVAGGLGLAAAGAAIWAIVAANETALLALVLSAVALWVMSTWRHLARRVEVRPAYR